MTKAELDGAELFRGVKEYVEHGEAGRHNIGPADAAIDPWMNLPWSNTPEEQLAALEAARATPGWPEIEARGLALWGDEWARSYDPAACKEDLANDAG